MPTHDDIDIDFSMFDLPTRPGPARAAAAPEQDSVEKRMAREVDAAPYINCVERAQNNLDYLNDVREGWAPGTTKCLRDSAAIEVKHGSGKVKV